MLNSMLQNPSNSNRKNACEAFNEFLTWVSLHAPSLFTPHVVALYRSKICIDTAIYDELLSMKVIR